MTQPTPSATYDRLDARNAGNDVGWHHDAARIPGGRRQGGHQGARARPRAARLGPAGDGRRGIHHEPGAGGARPRVARSLAAVRRHRARDRREQRLCQRVHGRRRPSGRARNGGRNGAAGRLSRRARPGLLDRRHRRRARHRQDSARPSSRHDRARRRSGRAGGPGDHDDRSLSQGSRRARLHGRTRCRHWRHGQGLRHDRAEDGDDAGFCDDRCRGPSRAPRSRASRGRQRDVQRHHRRRRVLDERLRDAARERRERRDRRRRRATRPSRTRSARSACAWRSASCAAAKARPSSSPSP